MQPLTIKPIAIFRSPFGSKFGVPRQAGVVKGVEGRIVLNKEFRSPDAVRGLEDFDYLWLIWHFSANPHQASGLTVRPPRLGGNKQMGVFATRSPFRPNPIGLSSVRIDHIDYECQEAPVIVVRGGDLMDGTPIFDIKPYVPYADAHSDARGGFTDSSTWRPLKVSVPKHLQHLVSDELVEVLAQDPRPRFHNDQERIYGMPYGGRDIKFRVSDDVLTIIDVVDTDNHLQ